MPIYEQIYRDWEGQLESGSKIWWVIGKTGIRLLWKKGMVIFLLLASIPFLIKTGQIYIMARLEDKTEIFQMIKVLKIDDGFFEGFLRGQTFFLILMIIFSGAGIIANDRKFKALQIYFSKPLNFWDYLSGKFFVICFFGCLITLIPSVLLFFFQILLTGDSEFFRLYYWIPLSVIGYVTVVISVLSILILTFSSIFNTRSAAILFFTIWWIPDVLRSIIGDNPFAGLFSIKANIRQVGSWFFGLERPYNYSVIMAVIVLAGITLICLFILNRRIKPTEVVK
jgi:ABC-type transport system involved in multi-copper enzyme maturation permease subunit